MNKNTYKKLPSSRTSSENKSRENEEDNGGRLDLIKDTLSDINHVMQTPHIFITINILLLLAIFIMGRIVIVFIDNSPPSSVLDSGVIEESLLDRSIKQYSPYYLSNVGNGYIVFKDHISYIDSAREAEVYTLSINKRINKNQYNSLKHIKLTTPRGERLVIEKSEARKEDLGLTILNTSGCEGTRCYIQLLYQDKSGNVKPGTYAVSGLNNDEEVIFEKSGYISSTEVSIKSTPPSLLYDIADEGDGSVSIIIKGEPSGRLIRLELDVVLSNGEIQTKRIFSLSDKKEFTFDLKEDVVGYKIYSTVFNPPHYDTHSRYHTIKGKHPLYHRK